MIVLNIDISVIIVNYKSWSHLQKCLESLIKITDTAFIFEVIVVDNCSKDDQLEIFKSNFKSVKFIENSANNGFANGCNFGAAQAIGTYLLFLNPDTIANKTAIEQLWQTAKSFPKYGIISCQQIDEKGNPNNHDKLFMSPSRMFGLFRIFYKIVNQSKLNERFNQFREVIFPDWVSGSVVFISKDWFNKVNGWCEDYWMYYEDVDLCKRITNSSGKIALLQNVSIIHAHGGSTRINVKIKALTKSEVIISRHVYIQKYFKGISRLMMQFFMIANQILVNLLMGLVGMILFFKPKFRIYFYLAINIFTYYLSSLFKQEWLSYRSVNYKHK